MNIVVPIKLVPDLVEEIIINDTGSALDMDWLSLILNEFDDHAIEQALLLKEQVGGEVIVIAPDMHGADDALFTAAAKGVDQLVKLTEEFEGADNHVLAQAMATAITGFQPDLILTGVQAHNDLDGPLGPLLAGYLDMPYVGYVAGVKVEGSTAAVLKEFPGGLVAKMEVELPAVFGIQASDQPPRYVAFSKIRQAMKTASITELSVAELALDGGPIVERMFEPESGEKATMIEGDMDEIAVKLVELFQENGIV
jgi:electron transfer flavoprotein beta subunit